MNQADKSSKYTALHNAYKKGTAFLCFPWDTHFRMPVRAKAVCEDGVSRMIRLNLSPDTFFSHPGRVTIKGRSVRGFVTVKKDENDDEYLAFIENTFAGAE